MMQRVLGVFATLAIVGVSAACSSSSGGTPPPATDSGKTDAATDTAKTDSGDTGADAAAATDNTTGKPCTTVDQCDLTGNGYAHCSNGGALGPYYPTAICMQYDPNGGDLPECAGGKTDSNGYPAQFKGCDNNLGLCNEQPTNKQPGAWTCDPVCEATATGTWTTQCAGKDGCSFLGTGTDSSGNTIVVGTCGAGCSSNADCPTGSVCDPLYKACFNVKCGANAASPNAECTALSAKLSSPLPAAWTCDTTAGSPTNGYCGFHYPKAPGAACDPTVSTKTCATDADCSAYGTTCDTKAKTCNEQCFCIGGTAATGAFCAASCKVGSDSTDCPTGFTCDPLWNANDSTGKPIFPSTFSWPAGTIGYCMKKCAATTDCGAGQACAKNGGMSQSDCL